MEQTNTLILPTTVTKTRPTNPFRPQCFKDYIGQENAKMIIGDAVTSAMKRNAPIEHVLLSSSGAGLGKSTMARIIAKESRREIIETTASSLEKPFDIFSLFRKTNRYTNPILFIDEIHNIKHSLAELLYMPMEDYGASIPLSEEVGDGRQKFLEVAPFTLITATAGEQGKLPKPFLDRFELKIILEMYTAQEISIIIRNNVTKLGVNVHPSAQNEVAKRACYTPRIANSLLKRLRDFAIAHDKTTVMQSDAITVFERLRIDELGLDNIGRNILRALHNSKKMRLGLNAIAQSVRLNVRTVQALYEPQLLIHNLISYLPNGRAITEEGENHIQKYMKF